MKYRHAVRILPGFTLTPCHLVVLKNQHVLKKSSRSPTVTFPKVNQKLALWLLGDVALGAVTQQAKCSVDVPQCCVLDMVYIFMPSYLNIVHVYQTEHCS